MVPAKSLSDDISSRSFRGDRFEYKIENDNWLD